MSHMFPLKTCWADQKSFYFVGRFGTFQLFKEIWAAAPMIMTIGGIRITICKEIRDKDDNLKSYTLENKHEKAVERCGKSFSIVGHTPNFFPPN